MDGAESDDNDEYELDEQYYADKMHKKGRNPFGSNFITAEELFSNKGATSGKYIDNGWESDVQEESDNERDEREERERKEFMEAIKASRSTVSSTLTLTNNDKPQIDKKKERELGRVFETDGDVMEDGDLYGEKEKSALEILEEKKRGKEIHQIDHSKVDYLPFRKNLYIVPRALSRLTEEENNERREDLQIKVRGKGCPALVDDWGQCGLSERLLQLLEKHNLKEPFAIQRQAIPAIMCGRDVIGVAKTGSGKTLAFLLPMIRHILDQPPRTVSEGPIAIIVAPARELAFQIYHEAKKFMKPLGLNVGCIYGGAGMSEQIAEIKRGADVIVCTPGRMIDILCMQNGKLLSLKRVTMVVMDEADRMFDMGFEPQIHMILQNIRPDRQTVLFSATFPKNIEELARKVLRYPLEIIVGERSMVNKDITQIVEIHDEEDKYLRLLQLLGVWYEKGSIIIFVDKQEKCDQLFQELLKSGYPCLSLHGGKDQLDRDHTIHEFKTLIKTVLIATSVAGRGLDVPETVLVINYNCPNHLEDYVHRVGRTGRAGRKGTAYTFIASQEGQYAPIMMRVLQKASIKPPEELVKMNNEFKEKVLRGEAKYVKSGFSGTRGFTFDADEMNDQQKLAASQKKAYELEQGLLNNDADDGDYADDENDDYDDDYNQFGNKFPASSSSSSSSIVTTDSLSAGAQASSEANAERLTPIEKAKKIAAAICKAKGLPFMPFVPAAAAKPEEQAFALQKAKQLALQIAAKLTGKDETTASNFFSDELDINDYPPLARRKITMKTVMEDIIERTGANVIQRGTFKEPGKKLELGERRLHLLIEAATELQVKQCKLELTRLLDEETLRLSSSASFSSSISGSSTAGRYSVL